ncbi:hypothetical protein [Paenibacillus sp. PCH8]|uniref:hypothetical protein n=1 Tax=Paenibacillus sp. PCH8 TaxID=2066524 RepID=UPI0015E48D32|nr:hypothetical protein [Paenibacillus sp. PCH8]
MMASAWQKLFSPQKLQLETLHLTTGLSWLIFYHLDYYCLPATNPIFSAKMSDDVMMEVEPPLVFGHKKNRHKGGFVRFQIMDQC